MRIREMFKCIAVLVVICVVISGALAVVNSYTEPVIISKQLARENVRRKLLLPDTTEFHLLGVEGLPASVSSAYLGENTLTGNLTGYVFTAGRKGFDGTIVVMAAIKADGTIAKVATMDVTSETKTLGGRTADAQYTDQYTGKGPDLAGVDIISGATVTSRAYEACIQDCFAAFDIVKEAGL